MVIGKWWKGWGEHIKLEHIPKEEFFTGDENFREGGTGVSSIIQNKTMKK